MTNIYKTPESNLDIEKRGPVPQLIYVFFSLFVLEAIFVIVINLTGSSDVEAVSFFSVEMLIMFAATLLILSIVWQMATKGQKAITTIIYIFLVLGLIFDASGWFDLETLLSISGILSLINFLLLLTALYMVKVPLKNGLFGESSKGCHF